jgi:hypothetical protein
MTSATDVERSDGYRFIYRCPCGSNIVTNKMTVSCAHCGKVMQVYRVRTRGRRRSTALPPISPSIKTSHYQTRRRRRYHSLYNERYFRLGLLFLLSPFYLPLLLALVTAVLTPAPPEQDRPHHYEKHNVVLHDGRGRALTIPTWKRVDD